MEYYCAIKRKEILVRGRKWINFENGMLSKGSQKQKALHRMIPFI